MESLFFAVYLVLFSHLGVIGGTSDFDLWLRSWETQDQLLELEQMGLSNFTAQPRPIYRKDLPEDYIAYWEIEINGSEYVTVSSSAKTGDYRLNQEGPLPSPTTLLDENAKLVYSTCTRYYMLSPDGQMFCEDNKGKIVATSSEGLLDNGINEKDAQRKKFKLEVMLQEQLDELQEEWDHRRLKTQQTAVWPSTTKFKKTSRRKLGEHSVNSDIFHGDSFIEQAISPGGKVQIAFGTLTTEIRIKVLPFDVNMTESDLRQWQERLCKVLNDICDTDSPEVVDFERLSVDREGRQMLSFEMHADLEYVKNTLEDIEIGFHVESHSGDDGVVLGRFGVDLTADGRSKRSTESKPWSSWTYSSINEEDLFPDYWQHTVEKCLSGCGPVAWAMVFGYYDRLAHTSTPHGHSRSLWRCDDGGTAGSDDCVAPATLNDQARLYIEAIRKEVGTFCLGDSGATPQMNMELIEGFYCDRQGDSAYITTVNTGGPHGFLGMYSDQVTNHIVNNLQDAKLPVVVGYRIGGSIIRQHYAVATKLRRRSRRYRKCYLWWCENWKTEWDNDIYIHLGGANGNGNGWRACEGFFSAVAYPSVQSYGALTPW